MVKLIELHAPPMIIAQEAYLIISAYGLWKVIWFRIPPYMGLWR
jgi:hypothetical protein